VFTLGSNVGGALSLLFGGAVIAAAGTLILLLPVLAHFEPWQIAFVIVGFPGLLFCALLATFREPPRAAISMGARYSFRDSVALIRRRGRFYGAVYAANGTLSMVALTIPAWFPTYLARVYGVTTGEIGLYFGLTLLICSSTGLLSGPVFARWLAARGYRDAPLRVAATSTIGMTALSLVLPLASNVTGAIILVGLLTFFTTICTPLLGFACQQATPSQVRGFASSLYTFSAMVVGYAIGPLLVAGLTDRVFRDPQMVGHSIQVVCTVASCLTGLFLLRTWRPFRDIMAAEDRERT
jgi:MFS family permease